MKIRELAAEDKYPRIKEATDISKRTASAQPSTQNNDELIMSLLKEAITLMKYKADWRMPTNKKKLR